MFNCTIMIILFTIFFSSITSSEMRHYWMKLSVCQSTVSINYSCIEYSSIVARFSLKLLPRLQYINSILRMFVLCWLGIYAHMCIIAYTQRNQRVPSFSISFIPPYHVSPSETWWPWSYGFRPIWLRMENQVSLYWVISSSIMAESVI